jgi:hypothetical protein
MKGLLCADIVRAALGQPRLQKAQELFYGCPNHDDHNPSLKVNPKKNLWMCGPCGKSGGPWALAAFLSGRDPSDKPAVTEWLRERGLLSPRGEPAGSRSRIVATYDYTDERSEMLYQNVRYEPKDFKQRRPNGKGGWVWNLQGVRRVLYCLPKVLAASDVIIVEGEKDADTGDTLGLTATTSGSTGTWRNEFSEILRGKRVTVIADADTAGRKDGWQIASSLSGKVGCLKLLELPGAKDLTEWVQRGGTREALINLIQTTPDWNPQSIDADVVLKDIFNFIRRFVSLSPSQARVVALWSVHTHVIDAADATPYLAITSAEKQSGKTRLLEVCELLVANPWLTGRVTAAVLIRKVDAERPSLLLDESDAAFSGEKEYAEALRSVLNTGHRRGGKASCCVGQGAATTFKDFSTFCPKAIAGIGRLPDTVADRSIPIRLKRAARGEHVERFRRRDVEGQAAKLHVQVEMWSRATIWNLRGARPGLPDVLTDRQQDGAEPLLAIADLVGGEWPQAARSALIELCAESQAGDESIGVRLLADIRDVFKERAVDRIPSADLAAALAEIETSPWGEWSKSGKPLSAAKLARLLRPYTIVPHSVRMGERTPKGYDLNDFQDAFERYLPPDAPVPPPPGAESATTPQAKPDAGSSDFSNCHTEAAVAVPKCETLNENGPCGVVADSEPPATANGVVEFEL